MLPAITSKYGSHVLEKALEASSGAELDAICKEIFDGYELSATGLDAFDIMVFDQYGNYVVQTLLKVCKAAHDGLRPGSAMWLQRIDAKIRSVQPRLGKYSSGKKIIELLDDYGAIEVLAAAQDQERRDSTPADELWDYDAGLGI
ncbi:pumilio-family RNA binding repeat containing protein [Aphelenchoides avenae]|nr:pumilio-family RNA binding repeat containing protein [Aphelenchus avenae]